jgi:WD40 repeat protein
MLALANDIQQFTIEFQQPISASTLHIYYSALAFTPKGSVLFQTYAPRFEHFHNVIGVSQLSWTASVTLEGYLHTPRATLRSSKRMFASEGERIISSCSDGTIRFWDGMSGLPTGTDIPMPCQGSIDVSSDGTRIIWTGPRDNVVLLDGITGAVLVEFITASHGVPKTGNLMFTPDGRRVVEYASAQRIFRLWDAASGTVVAEVEGATSNVVFTPHGKHMITYSEERSRLFQIWDTMSGAPIGQPRLASADICKLYVSPDGALLLTHGILSNSLELWDAATYVHRGNLIFRSDLNVREAGFCARGYRVYARVVEDGKLPTFHLWDAGTRSTIIRGPLSLCCFV